MYKSLIVIALIGLVASPALADFVPTVTSRSLDSMAGRDCTECAQLFANMDYVDAWDLGNSKDDYQIVDEPSCPDWPDGYGPPYYVPMFGVCKVEFIGGVYDAGDRLYFDFYDAGANWKNGFDVEMPSAGAAIWEFTFDCEDEFYVPRDGQMKIRGDYDFVWYSTNTTADLGTENITWLGPTTADSWCFSLYGCVPEPTSLMLLAFGGLALLRRR